jgi:hypothetical protein
VTLSFLLLSLAPVMHEIYSTEFDEVNVPLIEPETIIVPSFFLDMLTGVLLFSPAKAFRASINVKDTT